jgi:hypothetical protein
MRSRRGLRFGVLAVTVVVSVSTAFAQAPTSDIPRRPDGRPDLSGMYDIATLTPLQRPVELADKLVLTEEEAATLAAGASSLEGLFNIPDERNVEGGAPREAPPVGGDGSSGAAGNVGGYNSFWMDFGQSGFRIDGQFRTSIITDPPNGRRPPLTPAARESTSAFAGRPNTGTAWWLDDDLDAPGPYDHPERRPHAERCLMGFGSTAGPPMLPVLYNNLKRIVQTDDTVMILVEMVHDARIVRMNQEHVSPDIRTWLGDSVGHWDGDTLVVDTTNFRDSPSLGQASRNLHVVERFSRIDADTLLYGFTVEDPTVWAAPWSGEYVWPATDNKVYEYACHEANYSFGGILRGARVLEADAREAR